MTIGDNADNAHEVNFRLYAELRRLRRQLKQAREELQGWKDEAISHRRRLGLPITDVVTRRLLRPESLRRPTQTPEPASGSEDERRK